MAREIFVQLPAGGDEKHTTFSPEAVVTFTYMNGDEVAQVGPAPLGTSYLYNAPRRYNGDWYCELKGARYVCATGPTREAAWAAAIAKLAA